MNYRPERMANLIQVELSKLLVRDVNFGDAFVTVTGVTVNKKLEYADVRLGVIPSSLSLTALHIANTHVRELQHQLLKKLNIKPLPRVRFEVDLGSENAAAVEKALLEEEAPKPIRKKK